MYFLPGTGGTVLTHPHFPKLPTAELLHKFQRLPWDLPLVLCPGPLGNQGYAGSCEPLAQAVYLLCGRRNHRRGQWAVRHETFSPKLTCFTATGRSQLMGHLHNHTTLQPRGLRQTPGPLGKEKTHGCNDGLALAGW